VSDGESWVAIDFETASVRGTPCAVGLVEVVDGKIGCREGWLIRPPVFEFSAFNVALHRITPAMCREAPPWEESLGRILDFTTGRALVAHNAAFDVGVIRDACDLSGLRWPRVEYACTLVMGRRLWPELASHSLPFVVEHLGLDGGSHHNAGADALAAAEVGRRALAAAEAETMAELVASCGAVMGRVEPGGWRGCHGESRPELPTEPQAGTEQEPGHPLFGKQVAFTGALAIPRREAQQAVVDRGGVASRGVRRGTDLLVCGYQDLTKLAAGDSKSAKLRKAESLRGAGRNIEIIDEREFARLIEAGAE
jgi:DNA polymerase III subunit epsilon